MFGGGSSSAPRTENAIADDGQSGEANSTSSSAGGPVTKASPSPEADPDPTSSSPTTPTATTAAATLPIRSSSTSDKRRSSNGSPPTSGAAAAVAAADQKKRRSSGSVSSRASSLLASAKNSITGRMGGSSSSSSSHDGAAAAANQSPLQKLGKQDAALAVPQGQHNNSAGESLPGPRSTFRVGVWEDRNKKCRRTMEDTHAFLYNFLRTPAPQVAGSASGSAAGVAAIDSTAAAAAPDDMLETDNGYFAIFDGHAGTFAADWCGKKLHHILEDIIRQSPNVPIPELLDQTFTSVDRELATLPLKNSGCTAAVAVLRWEDRMPSSSGQSSTATTAATAAAEDSKPADAAATADGRRSASPADAHAKLKPSPMRQRVLYTANVGDARIVLCRSGKALRLSYDHKGSDENEGRRIANAGGLILHNRVNGVLAVTRALGDTYIKDLVTGHPYTTETVIQSELDEFIILACDGLWDVCSDQDAVNLVRSIQDPLTAAKRLVDHALARFSTDNLSCMIVRLDQEALASSQRGKDGELGAGRIGVEGDEAGAHAKLSEADKIVSDTKQRIAEGSGTAVGVSASNSGRGHGPASGGATEPTAKATATTATDTLTASEEAEAMVTIDDGNAGFKRTVLEESVQEEPAATGKDVPDKTPNGTAGTKA